jgi:hypothetical protein
MWEPRRLTTLWASTASYRDSFICFPLTNPFTKIRLHFQVLVEIRKCDEDLYEDHTFQLLSRRYLVKYVSNRNKYVEIN